MNSGNVPVFLHDYDWGGALQEWYEDESFLADGQKRYWTMRPMRSAGIVCSLSWVIEGQLTVIDGVAPSGEESVWCALEEFKRWEQAVEREGGKACTGS